MNSRDRLLIRIFQSNPKAKPLTTDIVKFSLPLTPGPEANGRNTSVVVSALPLTGYTGSVTLFYNRAILNSLGDSLSFDSQVPFTNDLIVAKLNGIKNTFITPDDLNPFDIPLMHHGDINSITLTANSKSLEWVGSITIVLGVGLTYAELAARLIQKQDLSERVTNFNMVDDSHYPTVKAVSDFVISSIENSKSLTIDGGFY